MIHSQVDDHTRYVAVALPLAVLLASALAEAGADETAQPAVLNPMFVLVPGLLVGLFTAYSLRAYALSEQAVDVGSANQWAQAAQRFDQASASDPLLAFYWEQAGYAYGRMAADGDQAALTSAIERLERARQLAPNYAVTHANLAALYWLAARHSEAITSIQRATELAPDAPQFWLNLGLYQEALHQADAAREAYGTTLKLSGLQAGSGVWSITPLRQAALADWQAQAGPEATLTLADRVQRQAQSGDAGQAERELIDLWQQNRQSVMVYVAFAGLARAQDDWPAAERFIQTAFGAQSLAVNEQVYALLYSAEIAQAQGKTEAAIGNYQFVLDTVTNYNIYGWGSAGWTPYAYFVYQRRALPVETLPQLAQADFTLDLGRRLLVLGELYEKQGDDERAAAVYRQLLAHAPQLTEAQDRLAELSLP